MRMARSFMTWTGSLSTSLGTLSKNMDGMRPCNHTGGE